MKIKINYPGYWAHGKVYEAEREDLIVRIGNGCVQDVKRRVSWGSQPTDDLSRDSVPCWIITKEDGQKFAIPCVNAVELVAEAT